MRFDDIAGNTICRDPLAYHELIHSLQDTFTVLREELKRVVHLAQKIRKGIENITPFIQQATRNVCPHCKAVCCISKHGYYCYEDLIYLFALGMNPPHAIFGRNDTDQCQYLLENGCSLERWIRPSGCTWYFCESLLDYMEPQSAYREFDDTLQDVANLWIQMTEEFEKIS